MNFRVPPAPPEYYRQPADAAPEPEPETGLDARLRKPMSHIRRRPSHLPIRLFATLPRETQERFIKDRDDWGADDVIRLAEMNAKHFAPDPIRKAKPRKK